MIVKTVMEIVLVADSDTNNFIILMSVASQ